MRINCQKRQLSKRTAKTMDGVWTYSQVFSRLVTGGFSSKKSKHLLHLRIKDKENYGMKLTLNF